MTNKPKWIVAIAAAVLVIAALAFTEPGHRMLNALGFATADYVK
jgi:hypothetical protein